MGHSSKVVTCCYCGSRAALVLTGRVQHELACGSCGAPLHELKSFPVNAPRKQRAPEPATDPHQFKYRKQKKKDKGRKRKKSYSRKAMSEIFDVIEDLFD